MKKLGKVIATTVSALTVLAAGGFAYLYNNGMSGIQPVSQPAPEQIRVACVGDSITYGHGVKNWAQNHYPAVLQGLLGDAYHVANFGSSGSCVNPDGDQPYITREVYLNSLTYDPDILVFMLGTNDAKPENWTDPDTFLQQYQELLGSYLAGTKVPKVYVCLCAQAYQESFDIQPEVVAEIVETIRGITAVGDCPVEIIDIYALTGAHPEWFAADGIHPDRDGAAAIAQCIAEAIAR